MEEAARLLDGGEVVAGGAAAAPRRARARLRHDLARDARADVAVGVPGDPRRARPRPGFDSPGFRAVAAATRRAGRAPSPRSSTAAGLELVELYQRGREFEELYQAAEALTDWDERIWIWRFRHYAVVARSLGEDTTGTQGTPVQVLGKLIAQRQLPGAVEGARRARRALRRAGAPAAMTRLAARRRRSRAAAARRRSGRPPRPCCSG